MAYVSGKASHHFSGHFRTIPRRLWQVRCVEASFSQRWKIRFRARNADDVKFVRSDNHCKIAVNNQVLQILPIVRSSRDNNPRRRCSSSIRSGILQPIFQLRQI